MSFNYHSMDEDQNERMIKESKKKPGLDEDNAMYQDMEQWVKRELWEAESIVCYRNGILLFP